MRDIVTGARQSHSAGASNGCRRRFARTKSNLLNRGVTAQLRILLCVVIGFRSSRAGTPGGPRRFFMKRCQFALLPIALLACVAGCGTGEQLPRTSGYSATGTSPCIRPTTPIPAYVFALAMSQEGSSTYSGASIAYNGSVARPATCASTRTACEPRQRSAATTTSA